MIRFRKRLLTQVWTQILWVKVLLYVEPQTLLALSCFGRYVRPCHLLKSSENDVDTFLAIVQYCNLGTETKEKRRLWPYFTHFKSTGHPFWNCWCINHLCCGVKFVSKASMDTENLCRSVYLSVLQVGAVNNITRWTISAIALNVIENQHPNHLHHKHFRTITIFSPHLLLIIWFLLQRDAEGLCILKQLTTPNSSGYLQNKPVQTEDISLTWNVNWYC